MFDCNRCAPGICCNTAPGCIPLCQQCLRCACQGKGVNQCGVTPGCNGICSVSQGCNCPSQVTNNPIFGPRTRRNMTCQEAQALIANPDQEARIFNRAAIETQCDPDKRLDCCKGAPGTTAALCGPVFGPQNLLGDCDNIMQSFCTSNPEDPLCACLVSELPVPECTSVPCRNTNAFKLSSQLSNQCQGTFVTCTQVFELSEDARNNLVDRNTILQTCNVDPINPTGASNPIQGTPSSSLGISAIVGISIGIVLAVVIIIVLAVLASEGKLSTKKKVPKKKSTNKKSSSSQKKKPAKKQTK